jgi:hypothetical protein
MSLLINHDGVAELIDAIARGLGMTFRTGIVPRRRL